MDSKPETEGDVAALARWRVGALAFLRLRDRSSAGSRHSRISVLLPEPLTPVTTIRRLSGKCTARSFRLFAAACWRVSEFNSEVRGLKSEGSSESDAVSPRRWSPPPDFGFRICLGF